MQTFLTYIKNNLTIILSITCVALLFNSLNQCSAKRSAEQEKENTKTFLEDSIQTYKNKAGQLVSEKAALKGEKDQLEVLLSKQIDSTQQLSKLIQDFKTVDAAGNIRTETKIVEIEIPFEEPVEFEFVRRWSKNTEFYSINGFTSQVGTTIDSLKLPTLISFGLGEKKTSFFSTEYRMEATSSNPHVTITGLDGGSFTTRRKRLGFSLFAGAALGDGFQLSPAVGGGLTYTLFWF